MKRRTLVVGLVLACSTSLFPAGAQGKALPIVDLDCGDEVSSSLRLAGNIGPCTEDPVLEITESNVTLDLNGFSVFGVPLGDKPDVGIAIAEGLKKATIRNGSLRTIDDVGIGTEGADRVQIRDMYISAVDRGIFIDGDDVSISNVTVSNAISRGIHIVGSSPSVTDSVVNNVGDFEAIQLSGHDATVVNNVVTDGADGISIMGDGANARDNDVVSSVKGIEILGGGAKVIGNDVTGGLATGIVVDAQNGTLKLRDNTSHDNAASGFAVIDASDATQKVKDNLAYGNGVVGCQPSTVCNQPATSLPLVDLECGDEVTESMRLAEDVGPCAGVGLVIDDPKITLDLNHKWVSGTGSTGVQVADTAKKFRLINGEISGFVTGVVSAARSQNVEGLYVHDVDIAVLLSATRHAAVSNTAATDVSPGGGYWAINLIGKSVSVHDVLVDGVSGDNRGIRAASPTARVRDNVAVGTGIAFDGNGRISSNVVVGSKPGFLVSGDGGKTKLIGNDAVDNDFGGVVAVATNGGRLNISNNDAYGNDGIGLATCGAKLKKNRSFGNSSPDDAAFCP